MSQRGASSNSFSSEGCACSNCFQQWLWWGIRKQIDCVVPRKLPCYPRFMPTHYPMENICCVTWTDKRARGRRGNEAGWKETQYAFFSLLLGQLYSSKLTEKIPKSFSPADTGNTSTNCPCRQKWGAEEIPSKFPPPLCNEQHMPGLTLTELGS